MRIYQVENGNFDTVAEFVSIRDAMNFMTDKGFTDTGHHRMIEDDIQSVWSDGNDTAYIVRYLLDDAVVY